MNSLIKRFLLDEAGATAIEYGLLAALVSISIIAAAAKIGGGVRSNFERVETAVN